MDISHFRISPKAVDSIVFPLAVSITETVATFHQAEKYFPDTKTVEKQTMETMNKTQDKTKWFKKQIAQVAFNTKCLLRSVSFLAVKLKMFITRASVEEVFTSTFSHQIKDKRGCITVKW